MLKSIFYIPLFLFIFSNKLPAQLKAMEAGIKIFDGTSEIFPPSWQGGKIKAKATAPQSNKTGIDTATIHTAMGKYPDKLLKSELRYIYLVGKLRFSGVNFFGTNSLRDIYIASDNNNEVEKTFHHEFSSILLRNHNSYTFEDKWKKLSPESLNTTSAAALKKGYSSTDYDTSLLKNGYLDLYSLSNRENDFNMYAENIFAGGSAFWKIADTYPKVHEKMRLVVEFYEKINPLFTEFYLRLLADDK